MSDDILVEFVTGPDSEADDAELEQLTLALRQEILQLDDVSAVEQATSPAPEGHKAGELAAIGSLIVSAVPGVEAAAKVLGVIRAWLGGRAAGTPTLKMTVGANSIELAADDDEQRLLVEQFIKALQASTAAAPAPPPATEG